ncbi:hypothetical protein MATL_G00025720 [Megalops atlanticus]|uniref:Fibrinogen C-terminal domain-containing protein n=1 Tax=Megalops atlanticus TaxID=7932 RepID=A0A9D3QHN3_MEGAT|nr:hypothetical protein MATL_G00025720 [Megalops atlanticus]
MRFICLLLFATLSCALSSKEVVEEDPAAAESRFAPLDDVRLLANGLLQLGQSLKEFVHKTKGQINDIFQKLNVFDTSFYQLAAVTDKIKEEEEELKRTTTFLKANNEEIRNLSLEINSKINSALQERSQLHSKVWALEGRLRNLSQHLHPTEQLTEISALKEMIDSQEKSITDLLKAVKEQHDQLNYQKNKIKSLEDKKERLRSSSADRTGEFWLGLEKIYSVARQSESILQIELEDWKEEKRFMQYQFSLDGPASHYTIHLKQLSGNVPDPMSNHTGMRFSTRDSDNDNDKDYNCAKSYTGGWWFNACGETNLNGKYIWVRPKGHTQRQKGIYWRPGSGNSYSLKSTKISIRHVPDVSSFH